MMKKKQKKDGGREPIYGRARGITRVGGWEGVNDGICTSDIWEGVNNKEELVIKPEFSLRHMPCVEIQSVGKFVAYVGAKTTNAKGVLICGASMGRPLS